MEIERGGVPKASYTPAPCLGRESLLVISVTEAAMAHHFRSLDAVARVLGEIAPGRRADMVVLRANPLQNIRNTRTIETVWLDGVQACGAL